MMKSFTTSATIQEILKWSQTIQISWSNQMAYKLNFLFVIIGPSLVFFLIKYNLWVSIYELDSAKQIGGYSLSEMLRYQALVLIVNLIAQSYNGTALTEDIRLGRISAYLVYPFSFWKFHFAGFLAFQGLQILVTASIFLVLLPTGMLDGLSWPPVLLGLLFSVFVGVFWFLVQFLVGISAFWLEETWVFRVIFLNVGQFLSGAIIPLELFPNTVQALLALTPFPAMTYIPVKIMTGAFDGTLVLQFFILGFWIVITAALCAVVWKRGLKLYTAAGM